MALIHAEQTNITGSGGSSEAYVTTASFGVFTSSYYTDSSSFDTRINSIYFDTGSLATTASLNTLSSSLQPILGNIFASQSNYISTSSYAIDSASFGLQITSNSSSIVTLSGSYHLDSASFYTKINNVSSSIPTGSFVTTSSFNTFSSSYVTDSSSFNNRIISATGSITSVSNSDGTLTISPTTGAVIASLNLAHANTWTAAQIIEQDNLASTTLPALTLLNTTASISTQNQVSPALIFSGTGWKTNATAGSQSTTIRQYLNVLASTVSPLPSIVFDYNQNGGAYINFLNLLPYSPNGHLVSPCLTMTSPTAGGIEIIASGPIYFSNNAGTHIQCLSGNQTNFAQQAVQCSSANAVLSVGTTGNAGINIGTSVSTSSAQLQMLSTTRGFLPPRMTTTQKNAIASPAEGLVVYDLTLRKLCVYTSAWETITSV